MQADEFENPADLHLDLKNPRMTDGAFENEDDMLEYLVDHADVDELLQSILNSGWLDYEPLIVVGDIVLEGNRRLAALRILSNETLRKRLRIDLPFEPNSEALPEAVRVRRVGSRSEARDFIGFKHINGTFKWDALAKAKYAADWFAEDGSIGRVSRRLGDTHHTVVRLVNGWHILLQSYDAGFDRNATTKRSFSFSHLYTAITRPNVRRYLRLPEGDGSQVLPLNSVPAEKIGNLRRLMSWLYGQNDEPAVVFQQNPHLSQLVEVLGNERALTMLEATRNLNDAFGEVEDKALRFGRSLALSIKHAEDAMRLMASYDGGPALMSVGDNLRRAALSLHGAMKAAKERADEGDAGDDDGR